MRDWVSVLVLCSALFVGGCAEENRVEVSCAGAGIGYQCSIRHVQGADRVEACWTVQVACVNGTSTSASACQLVQPGGTVGRLIPLSEFPDAQACDLPSSVQVVMSRVTVR